MVFDAWATSALRPRVRRHDGGGDYRHAKGLSVVMVLARDVIATRPAPGRPVQDSRPMLSRGHPDFVAPHATAYCCRCLEPWHGLPRSRTPTPKKEAHVVTAVARWLRTEGAEDATPGEADHTR
jgi:hypothetical protein